MKEVYAIGDIIITGFNPQIYKIKDIHTSWGGENSYGTFELGKLVPRLPHYQINHDLTAKLQNFVKLRDSGCKFCVLVESEEEKNLYLDWMSYLGYDIGSRKLTKFNSEFVFIHDYDNWNTIEWGSVDGKGSEWLQNRCYNTVKFSELGIFNPDKPIKREVDVRTYEDQTELDKSLDKTVAKCHYLDILSDILTKNILDGVEKDKIIFYTTESQQVVLDAIRYYQKGGC